MIQFIIAIYTITYSETNLMKDMIVLYGKNYKILLGDKKVFTKWRHIHRWEDISEKCRFSSNGSIN